MADFEEMYAQFNLTAEKAALLKRLSTTSYPHDSQSVQVAIQTITIEDSETTQISSGVLNAKLV